MTRNRMHLALAALTAAAVGVVLAGCGGSGDQTTVAAGPTPVEVASVARETVSPTADYSGTVEAGKKTLVGAEIQGSIERIHVEVGDSVKEGDLLAELATEQLTQARAQSTAAEKDWDRARELFEKGAITKQAYDHATAAVDVARASYEMVLASCQLRAPFDGIITQRFFDQGEVYTLMAMSAGAPAVFEIADLSDAKVAFQVGERERALIYKGLVADVAVDSRPGKVFKGKVTRVDPALDLMSRTATVEVTITDAGSAIMPGAFAKVQIGLAPRETILIPRDALVRQEGTGSFFVYVVNDSVAKRSDVKLGEGFGGDIEILGGLSGGEQVITAGRYRLHDGSAIQIKPPAAGETPPGGLGGTAVVDSSAAGSGQEAAR